MSRQRVIYREKDDVVKSTLNEIIRFLLLSFLLFLGDEKEALIDGRAGLKKCVAEKKDCEFNSKQTLLELAKCEADKELCKFNYEEESRQHKAVKQAYGICEKGLEQCGRIINDFPSSIALSEADGNTFVQGEIYLSSMFRKNIIKRIIPAIETYIAQKNYVVERILIIGHTDETPKRGNSTLDDKLVDFLYGDTSASSLRVADNAGLGLARAASVRQYLLKNSTIFEKENIPVLILSAGQATEFGEISDRITDSEDRKDERRRVEIYLVTYPKLYK